MTLASLVLASCGLRRHVAASALPLEQERVGELASFQCVTGKAAVQLKEALRPEDPAYTRGAALYADTREAYNPIIEGIAGDVARGADVDVEAYWTRLAAAREPQQELIAYLEQQETGFGFVGLETLAAFAAPYAKRMVRSYVDQKLRDYAAAYLRDELLLPPMEQAATVCAGEAEADSGGAGDR